MDGAVVRPRLFGTDGVRGIANVEPLTAETVLDIGRAVAHVCAAPTPDRPRVVIGRDTRVSGPMLEGAMTAGLCSMGVDVLAGGVLPTPAVAFLTRGLRADAGIVISASHNPFPDNGIKVFRGDGRKLSDAEEATVEALVDSKAWARPHAHGAAIGRAVPIEQPMGRYLEFCRRSFPAGLDLAGLRIVLDCANGATSHPAPIVFAELGAVATVIHDAPDGLNINEQCGATDPRDLAREVRETGADLGLAFDGDGDRVLAVDEQGRALSGDHLLAICARYCLDQGRLPNRRIAATVMSNFGLHVAMKEAGIEVVDCPVGDRYVAEAMTRHGAMLGGESSGHVIFHDLHTTGDGILAGLQLAAAMRASGRPLSELASVLALIPQQLINVDVARKPPLEDVPEVRSAVERAEQALGGDGRVLVRYSGTQPLCRVMVEGRDEALTRRLAESLAEAIRASLG